MKIKVWDVPTRLFHWTLVGLVFFSWLTTEVDALWPAWHERSGIAILVLVVFRILYGFVGSETARFRHFLTGPAAAIAYGKGLVSGSKDKWLGHTPGGGLAILALLGLLGLQATLGLFANDGDNSYYEGPFYKYVGSYWSGVITEVHEALFNVLMAVVAVHVAVVFFYLLAKGENLIRAMVTGTKDWDGPAVTAPRFVSPVRAVVLLAASGAFVWWVVKGF